MVTRKKSKFISLEDYFALLLDLYICEFYNYLPVFEIKLIFQLIVSDEQEKQTSLFQRVSSHWLEKCCFFLVCMEISQGLILSEDVFEKVCLKLMLTIASKKNQNNHLQNGHYIHCVKSVQIFASIRTEYRDLRGKFSLSDVHTLLKRLSFS